MADTIDVERAVDRRPLEPIVGQPFFSRNGVTIYNENCLDVLTGLKVDVIVTDPPFGIDVDAAGFRNSEGSNGKRVGLHVNDWHQGSDWDKAVEPEWCKAVCDAAPVVLWFGHWRKRGEVEAAMPHKLRAEIVWAKDCHVGPPCPLAMRDERIWLFSRDGFKGNHFETSVWDEPIIPTWEHKWHKNEKPLGLMRRLIRFACKSGDTICDPFMGSGTTLRAAVDLGHPCIGIDISEDHCRSAVERLKQRTLFAG